MAQPQSTIDTIVELYKTLSMDDRNIAIDKMAKANNKHCFALIDSKQQIFDYKNYRLQSIDAEYSIGGHFTVQIDSKAMEFAAVDKKYNKYLHTSCFSNYFTCVNNIKATPNLPGCCDVTHSVLFEIDVDRHNNSGRRHIETKNKYTYDYISENGNQNNFPIDEVKELKKHSDIVYAVTDKYYYVIVAPAGENIIYKEEDISEHDLIDQFKKRNKRFLD